MHVEKPIYQNKLFDAFFKSTAALGLKPNDDFNDWSHEQDGYGDFQVSITARGRRADAHRSFIKPIEGRENLTVVTRAQTKRILFEQRGGMPTAVGVEVHSVRVRPSPRWFHPCCHSQACIPLSFWPGCDASMSVLCWKFSAAS